MTAPAVTDEPAKTISVSRCVSNLRYTRTEMHERALARMKSYVYRIVRQVPLTSTWEERDGTDRRIRT
jgi:hypothetical protein